MVVDTVYTVCLFNISNRHSWLREFITEQNLCTLLFVEKLLNVVLVLFSDIFKIIYYWYDKAFRVPH
jgi:hypothetical protein